MNDGAASGLEADRSVRGRCARAGRRLAVLGLAVHAGFVPISIAGMQIGLGMVAAGLLLALFAGARPRATPLDGPLLALVATCVFSELHSAGGPPPLAQATLWRSLLGFWLVWQGLSLSPAPRRTARWMLALAALALALGSLLGVAQFQTGLDLVHWLGLRAHAVLVAAPGVAGHYAPTGFFISRLTFGHNALVLIALLAGTATSGAAEGRLRALLLGSAALGCAALLLTFDRAAWLGLAAAGAVLLWARSARQRWSRLGLATLPAATATLLVWAPARARLFSAFDSSANHDRLFLWARALEIIRDHPLWGIGFGNYSRVCPRYYDRVDPSFYMRTWAHNSALSLLAETGPLGLAAALWLGLRTARLLVARVKAGAPHALGALAAAAALLVVAQVHDVIYDSKVMYALWLALALGLHPLLAEPAAAA